MGKRYSGPFQEHVKLIIQKIEEGPRASSEETGLSAQEQDTISPDEQPVFEASFDQEPSYVKELLECYKSNVPPTSKNEPKCITPEVFRSNVFEDYIQSLETEKPKKQKETSRPMTPSSIFTDIKKQRPSAQLVSPRDDEKKVFNSKYPTPSIPHDCSFL